MSLVKRQLSPAPRRHDAAALSALIAIELLTAVNGLFQHDGTPFEQVVIAEHACTDHALVSERETCLRLYLAASRV